MSKELHKEVIEDYINSKSSRIFSNSNKELFKLLLETLFTSASTMNWFISDLDRVKFFLNKEGLDLIENFVKKNTFTLIFIKGNEELIKNLNSLSLKYKNFKVIQKHKLNYFQNILTWDNIGYRFSPDPNRLTGVACANDEEFVKKCNAIFNKLLNEKG